MVWISVPGMRMWQAVLVVVAAAVRSVVPAVVGRKSRGVGMGDLGHGDRNE
jgi:hypothetical protein